MGCTWKRCFSIAIADSLYGVAVLEVDEMQEGIGLWHTTHAKDMHEQPLPVNYGPEPVIVKA